MAARPNLFILGAPKCATSSLTTWLQDHPQVFMSGWKEPRFFDRDLRSRMRVGEQAYLDLFAAADEQQHLAVGEATPWYLYSRVAVPNILEFAPEARFVVGVRNPVDMAHALWEQLCMDRTETITDFGEAWRASPERRAGRRVPRKAGEPLLLDYQSTCMLGEQVERVLEHVPRARLHVVVLDELRADPRRAYVETLDFLGVPDDGRTDFPVANAAKAVRFQSFQMALNTTRKLERVAKAKLGRPAVNSPIMRRLNQANRTARPRTPMAPAVRAELAAFFADDVDRLASVTGLDLSGWSLRSGADGAGA